MRIAKVAADAWLVRLGDILTVLAGNALFIINKGYVEIFTVNIRFQTFTAGMIKMEVYRLDTDVSGVIFRLLQGCG
jgi:hypothetical protein